MSRRMSTKHFEEDPEVKYTKIFINNEWVDSGKCFNVLLSKTDQLASQLAGGFANVAESTAISPINLHSCYLQKISFYGTSQLISFVATTCCLDLTLQGQATLTMNFLLRAPYLQTPPHTHPSVCTLSGSNLWLWSSHLMIIIRIMCHLMICCRLSSDYAILN